MRKVLIVLFDGAQSLDVTGPLEVFAHANSCRARHGEGPWYDIATASLIEVWIDETERRTWFLFEASRRGDSGGR